MEGQNIPEKDATKPQDDQHSVALLESVDEGISRTKLGGSKDRGTTAKLFAQEAEYYQDITFPALGSRSPFRMIVDVLDTLSIGEGTAIPSDGHDQVRVFSETVVVTQFKAKSVLIACHTLTGGGKESCITVSPEPKKDFDAPQLKGPGNDGARGDDAGGIVVFVETVEDTNPDAFPVLDARGGGGQNGQHSQDDAGGAPGYGGDGGNVTVVYSSPLKRAINVINDALNPLTGPNARMILSTLKSLPDQKIELWPGKTLETLLSDNDPFIQAMRELFLSSTKQVSPGSVNDFDKKLRLIINTLNSCINTLNTRIQDIETSYIYPRIHNTAGASGNYGTGPKRSSSKSPTGKEPVNGNVVVKAVADLSELPWAADDGIDCRTFVSDMQSAMLLQKARMAYFYGDVSEGNEAQETMSAAKIFFDRLASRLSFVKKLTAPDTRSDPDGIFARLSSVLNKATAYQTQFNLGCDYYGHAYGQVPLLSLERYQEMVSRLSGDFKEIEQSYADYFAALIENKAEMNKLSTAGDKLTSANNQLARDQQILRETAGGMAYDISCLTDALVFKRDNLDVALTNFDEKINNYFHLDFKKLLEGLSVIAFAPSSGAMWATQAASWIYNGATTIPNDAGETINKDYIVQKVGSVKANEHDISEGFTQLNGGLFEADDPGANKLIAEQKDMEKFLKDFRLNFKDDVRDVEKAFDDYVSAAIERNNKILGYNAALSLLLKKKQEEKDNEKHQQDIRKKMADEVSPALPSITASASFFYHAARDQLLELLYQMTRAYQFRTLDNTNLIAKYMSENRLTPAGLNTSHISTMYATSDSTGHLTSGIAWEWYQAQESMGKFPPSVFPRNPDAWGARYRFTDPGILETFRQVRTSADNKTHLHSVSLSIPIVYPYSSSESTMAGMSDIRSTNIRAWLDGVRIIGGGQDDLLSITIVHTGQETIVDPLGSPFSFTHAPVTKVFSYYPDKLPIDPKQFPKDAIFADSEIDKTGNYPTYAPIGPFTTWEVRLTNSYTKRQGLLDAMSKNIPPRVLEGKDITCTYPSRSPTTGRVGKVTEEDHRVTIEILNVVRRKVDLLLVEGNHVFSQDVLKGAEISDPNSAISFFSESEKKLDFSDFKGICLEFSGTGRGFRI